MDDNVKPKDGIGMYEYSDGSVYDGEWRDGKRHGIGTMKYEDAIYEGEWQNGKMAWNRDDEMV